MEKELKFKPNQVVRVEHVRSASAVGYLGVYYKVCDYVASPNFLKKDTNGEWLYLCKSENGYFDWWHEDEIV